MKRQFISIIIFLCVKSSIFAQTDKFILLDSIASNFKIFSYNLNSTELYGVDQNIEIFNLYTKHGNLVLLSVLPDFGSKDNWEAIDVNKIKGKLISPREFVKTIENIELGESNIPSKFFFANIIKRENNNTYASKVCFFEFFFIKDYPDVFRTPKMTINTLSEPHSIREIKKTFEEHFSKNYTFPMELQDMSILYDREMERIYLSDKFHQKSNQTYKFWTFSDYFMIGHGYMKHRGIDRFLYIPEKGIVGGSYDFYFLYSDSTELTNHIIRTTKTKDELQQNIYEEKVMLAEELKE